MIGLGIGVLGIGLLEILIPDSKILNCLANINILCLNRNFLVTKTLS
jgi:hypothetical protein